MTMIPVRQVVVIGGPQDGRMVLVATCVVLPETLSFPADPVGVKRHVYKRVEEKSGFSAYKFDHVEVGT